jgi:hypothetical protein
MCCGANHRWNAFWKALFKTGTTEISVLNIQII